MARSRNIKPGLFQNEILGVADPIYTLAFQGLWLVADREGRLEDRPQRIRAQTFPYRTVDMDALLDWLHTNGFILRYTVGEKRFIQVLNFGKHQNPHKNETESVIPSSDGIGSAPEEIGTPSDGIGSAPADSLLLIPDSLNPSTAEPASDDAGCCQPAADNEKTDRQKSESCPYQQIIGVYHKHFPSGPQVSKITEKRKRAIAARWREVRNGEYRTAGQPQAPRDQDKALHFFERYFTYCESLPWCTGRQPMKDGGLFRATIDNLIGADFMAKRSDEAHDAREAV